MSKGKIIGLIGGVMVFIGFIWILVNSWNQVIDGEEIGRCIRRMSHSRNGYIL